MTCILDWVHLIWVTSGAVGGDDGYFSRKVGRTRSRINGLKVSLTMETLVGKLVGLGVG